MPVQVQLPTSLNRFDTRAVLDGQTLTLFFEWNPRLEAWFMDVLNDSGDVMLLASVRLVPFYLLGLGNTGRGFPGYFYLRDSSGVGVEPGFDSLNATHFLVYFSAADVAPLGI